MVKQLIFCVETNSKAETDWVYIKDTINQFYELSNAIRINRVFFSGKGNYKSTKVKSKIHDLINKFKKSGKTYVIYCIDTDDCNINQERKKEFEDIHEYCTSNDYDFVWFCRDIEEVYLGKRIDNSEKKKEAAHFRNFRLIESVDSKRLRSKIVKNKNSNILTVLDTVLK